MPFHGVSFAGRLRGTNVLPPRPPSKSAGRRRAGRTDADPRVGQTPTRVCTDVPQPPARHSIEARRCGGRDRDDEAGEGRRAFEPIRSCTPARGVPARRPTTTTNFSIPRSVWLPVARDLEALSRQTRIRERAAREGVQRKSTQTPSPVRTTTIILGYFDSWNAAGSRLYDVATPRLSRLETSGRDDSGPMELFRSLASRGAPAPRWR